MKARILMGAVALGAGLFMGSAANAQQTPAVPGTPGYTAPIDGRYLPAAPPPFAGAIGTRRRLDLTLQNANVLDYVLTGHERASGWLWQKFTRTAV